MTDLIDFDRKTGSYNSGSFKDIITINSVYDAYKLFDLSTSDGKYLASIAWIGTSVSSGEKVMQPAIITNNPGDTYLAYDGRANYLDGSDLIIMPSHGSIYPMESGRLYYFSDNTPEIPNSKYALMYNNTSIRMNNISIFNGDFSKGIMMDFRSSMEGTFSDGAKNGYVVVLATIDSIN